MHYARGVDRGAPELITSAFRPDAVDDHAGTTSVRPAEAWPHRRQRAQAPRGHEGSIPEERGRRPLVEEETGIIHSTKADAVAKWIRTRILSGELVPGAALQQEDLARQLDVSSTPVREAFVTLESEGYVERRPHRGAVVTRPPYGEIEEIREVRNAMDRLAVARICESPEGPDLLAPLNAVMEESRLAVAANDPVRWQRSAFEVHHAIAL